MAEYYKVPVFLDKGFPQICYTQIGKRTHSFLFRKNSYDESLILKWTMWDGTILFQGKIYTGSAVVLQDPIYGAEFCMITGDEVSPEKIDIRLYMPWLT